VTLAEQSALKAEKIKNLRERIRAILRGKGAADLPVLETCLRMEELARFQRIESLETFLVRDAIYEMVRAGEAEYTPTDEVRLTTP
jgi:hypothetical protein